ncbi:MAG: SUMF1/EgtB/PvdO family nonheme iron enzyme, partial [Myxococcota bacterium]|nr:SUMF1/EgtB/PvdO family nonheme iron enzyme [Myxococcota bacterium]
CTGYRLLTEAEWEYAARAGTTAAFWTPNGGGEIPNGYESYGGCNLNWTLSDGTALGALAWFCGNNQWSNSSYPLGSKEVATRTPNDNGLYDMSGNLWEWTHDTYTASLGTGATTDPVREMDSNCVFRGGYWKNWPYDLRSARRNNHIPSHRTEAVGFRVGRSDNAGKPSAPDISIDPSSATELVDDLTCVIDTDSVDPDGNSITYTFEWTVNGTAYTGTASTTTHSGDTISASETTAGEVWECSVTPNDGTEDGYTGSASVNVSGSTLSVCREMVVNDWCQSNNEENIVYGIYSAEDCIDHCEAFADINCCGWRTDSYSCVALTRQSSASNDFPHGRYIINNSGVFSASACGTTLPGPASWH